MRNPEQVAENEKAAWQVIREQPGLLLILVSQNKSPSKGNLKLNHFMS